MNNEEILLYLKNNIENGNVNFFQDLQFLFSIEHDDFVNFINENIDTISDYLKLNSLNVYIVQNVLSCYDDLNEYCYKKLIDTAFDGFNNLKNLKCVSLTEKHLAYLVYLMENVNDRISAKKLVLHKLSCTHNVKIMNILYYEYKCIKLIYDIILNVKSSSTVYILKNYKAYFYKNYIELKMEALKGAKKYFNYCEYFEDYISDKDIEHLVKKINKYDFYQLKKINSFKNINEVSKQKVESMLVLNKLK